jgi:hypothetical protein
MPLGKFIPKILLKIFGASFYYAQIIRSIFGFKIWSLEFVFKKLVLDILLDDVNSDRFAVLN